MAEFETKTIGIVQHKGGVGRSTAAVHIAAALAEGGETVSLVDADQPQGSAASWAALRQAALGKTSLSTVTAANFRELAALGTRLQGKSAWVVIDGQPRIAEGTRAIAIMADLLIVPLSHSLAEVWSAQDLLPLIAEARKERGTIDARLLWTRWRGYTRLAQDLETQAVKELGLKPFKTKLGFRTAYAEALGSGYTVGEGGDPLAREEIAALTTEIRRIFK
jgi:chromosome partitioning protein